MRIPGILLALAIGFAACSSPAKPSGLNHQYESAHFVFHHDGGDRAIVPTIAARVEAEFSRIVSDLGAPGVRRVQVFIYGSHEALAAAVEPVAGPIPEWATGLVTAADRIHMLSPRATGASDDEAAATLLHEFTHSATLFMHAGSANNPRWLWEAVALLEANQRVDPRTLSYMVSGSYPTLAELNSLSDRRIYDVGYLLGEFVVLHWHFEGLRALIRAGGHLETTLGLSAREFEAEWIAYVRGKYDF